MRIDDHARQIHVRLGYVGPGLGGKTTCLRHVHDLTSHESKPELVSSSTETERTLCFKMVPKSLGSIAGRRLAIELITAPGAVFHELSRRLVLKEADGVLFVADSQVERTDACVESYEVMEGLLATGIAARRDIPRVLAYNKRDLPNARPMAALDADLNPLGSYPSFTMVAVRGIGVFDSLRALATAVLANVRAELGEG